MKKIIFYMMTFCALMSCQDNENVLDETVNINKHTHAISIDEALANLHAFMNDSTETRSCGSDRIVKSIKPVKISMLQTRSTQEIPDCENVVYVANFEDEEGYAILAADDRVEADVIAITDEGNIEDATIYKAVDLINSERQIIEGYPTTGPGFLTLPECGDELFMNPNTVCLYNDTIQDTMVGTLMLDDVGAVDENGDSIISDNVEEEPVEILSSALCISYALNEIEDTNEGTGPATEQDVLIPDFDVNNEIGTRSETIISEWCNLENITPMLSIYDLWHQNKPFNDLSPRRRKFVIVGNRRKAPAGCFPLAIAKVMTYFQYPEDCYYNNQKINWDGLNARNIYTIDSISASHLLRMIGSGCDSWYFYNGTFTFPSEATSFMRRIGINNAHSYKYSFSRVRQMLNNGCPVIIYGVPGIYIHDSHCWNIDGYKIRERTFTYNRYEEGILVETKTWKETSEMVHCDFGWGRKSNGYYTSGVFNLGSNNIELDYPSKGKANENYTSLIKIIMYDKPQ